MSRKEVNLMRCNDCGAKVVSSGLLYCPKCSGRLHKRTKSESRHSLPAGLFYSSFMSR